LPQGIPNGVLPIGIPNIPGILDISSASPFSYPPNDDSPPPRTDDSLLGNPANVYPVLPLDGIRDQERKKVWLAEAVAAVKAQIEKKKKE
jgi:hypothetical protein